MTNDFKRSFYGKAHKSVLVLIFLIKHAQWLLLAAFFSFATGPHIRANEILGVVGYATGSCTYLGSRGFVPGHVPNCPFLVWIDSRSGT